MTTTELAWRITANQRERRSFVVLDGEDNIDLTGWTIDAKIRTRPGGLVLHTVPDDLAVFVDASVEIVIPAPISAAWAWTTGWYRVVCTAPGGTVDDPTTYRVLQGPVVIDPD